MLLRCNAAAYLALLSTLTIGAAPLRAAEARSAPLTPCPGAARYVMPDGVELPPEGASGSPALAPADLPGSRSGYRLPPKLGFDLSVNPVGPDFDQSRLPLGHIEIDRKTGAGTIDGKRLGGPSEAETGCVQAKSQPAATR
jgi:hypothetical protein